MLVDVGLAVATNFSRKDDDFCAHLPTGGRFAFFIEMKTDEKILASFAFYPCYYRNWHWRISALSE